MSYVIVMYARSRTLNCVNKWGFPDSQWDFEEDVQGQGFKPDIFQKESNFNPNGFIQIVLGRF